MTFDEINKHCSVSRETFERLQLFAEQLIIWNKKINLVGSDTIVDLWKRHILDGLQLLTYLKEGEKLADMGSGAGLPGLVLAIAGDFEVSLIESDQKKVAFLRHIKGLLELDINIFAKRIEMVDQNDFDVVTARALASLDKLLTLSTPLLKEGGYCLFLKGETVEKEVEEAQKKWHFNIDVYPSVTHKSGTIIKLSEVKEHGEDKGHCNFEPKGRRREDHNYN